MALKIYRTSAVRRAGPGRAAWNSRGSSSSGGRGGYTEKRRMTAGRDEYVNMTPMR